MPLELAARALVRALGYDTKTHQAEAVEKPFEGMRVYGPGHLCVKFVSWDELEAPEMDERWRRALKFEQEAARPLKLNRKTRRALAAVNR